ncbi:hypothetical protein V6N13_038063 [Hibiscus sabdariffa]
MEVISLPTYVTLSCSATNCCDQGRTAQVGSDIVGWHGGVINRFTLKSTYGVRSASQNLKESIVWKVVHKHRGIQRIRIFMWLVCLNCIMTNVKRGRRHLTSNIFCPICHAAPEDVDHYEVGLWCVVWTLPFAHWMRNTRDMLCLVRFREDRRFGPLRIMAREGNRVADDLAKEACSNSFDVSYYSPPPSMIVRVLSEEMVA